MSLRHSSLYHALNSLYKGLFVRFNSHRDLYRAVRDILGFYPNHYAFYEKALIHRSASYESNIGKMINNERLEYLGDAILSAIIAEYLYYKFPEEDEGFLTKMRSRLVNRRMLGQLALEIGLNHLVCARIPNISENKNVYGDTFEAFIGALYLDKGYNRTRKFITRHLIRTYIDVKELRNQDTNFKSRLIEWSQKHHKSVQFVTDLNDSETRIFLAKVLIELEEVGTGTGLSKKEAEQKAAYVALQNLGVIDKEV